MHSHQPDRPAIRLVFLFPPFATAAMNIYAHYSIEQARALRAKPIAELRWFAELLGWRGLQLYCTTIPAEVQARWNIPGHGYITYYGTPGWRFALQINEADPTDDFTHKATVIPDRYGLRNMGWHPFTLTDDQQRMREQAAQIRPHLGRQMFKDKAFVRQFKLALPDRVLPSRKRRRGGK